MAANRTNGTALELLAPAKNKDIGIAAIDCGADAVYIAGPRFGARQAAGNQMREIEELCNYAHRFRAKVYLTLNTILFDNELKEVERLVSDAWEAGCDALIIQDLSILKMNRPPIPLYASTQCNIRTPEQARFLESLGFKRLILARELSLSQIHEIRSAVKCELESFIHGALCVSYSGRCYMSCHLTGRSANRGACIQACRSRYDVEDADGHIVLRDRAVLSLKDLDLSEHLADLIDAGITSFKIEGRLKNASYVKNVVRNYSTILDSMNCGRTSVGHLHGGFIPLPNATFTRGGTPFFIEGERGKWSSMDTAKGIGEKVGKISRVARHDSQTLRVEVMKDKNCTPFSNGDGLCFISGDGKVCGARVDIAEGNTLIIKKVEGIKEGTELFRNYNAAFEKELEHNMPKRLIDVQVSLSDDWKLSAISEDGAEASITIEKEVQKAQNRENAALSIRRQLGKITEPYAFSVITLPEGHLPFLPVSQLNGLRRELATQLDRVRLKSDRLMTWDTAVTSALKPAPGEPMNCANKLSREFYSELGLSPEPAFELSRNASGEYRELMRTKYCLRYELGLCHKSPGHPHPDLLVSPENIADGPFSLLNNGKRFHLSTDCANCENVITL